MVVDGAEAVKSHSNDTFWPIVDTFTGMVNRFELIVASLQSISNSPSSWLVRLIAKVYCSPSMRGNDTGFPSMSKIRRLEPAQQILSQ